MNIHPELVVDAHCQIAGDISKISKTTHQHKYCKSNNLTLPNIFYSYKVLYIIKSLNQDF